MGGDQVCGGTQLRGLGIPPRIGLLTIPEPDRLQSPTHPACWRDLLLEKQLSVPHVEGKCSESRLSACVQRSPSYCRISLQTAQRAKLEQIFTAKGKKGTIHAASPRPAASAISSMR